MCCLKVLVIIIIIISSSSSSSSSSSIVVVVVRIKLSLQDVYSVTRPCEHTVVVILDCPPMPAANLSSS